MRTHTNWLAHYNEHFHDPAFDFATLVRAIQCDAARSERERAARVCEEQVEASRAMGEPSGLAELCRNRIRSLPDVDPA